MFYRPLVPSCGNLCVLFSNLTECHLILSYTSHIASNGPRHSVCFLADAEELSAGRPALREQSCVCDGGECERDRRCTGQQCFSAMRTVNGAVVQQKGCLRDDEEGRATCATPSSSTHVVKCCQGHLCNMNVTVQAPGRGDFLHTIHILLAMQSCALVLPQILLLKRVYYEKLTFSAPKHVFVLLAWNTC